MSVYVDQERRVGQTPRWQYKYACHMVADSLQELREMADKIGLSPEWEQQSAHHVHFDLTANKRTQALAAGAISDPGLRVFFPQGREEKCLIFWT